MVRALGKMDFSGASGNEMWIILSGGRGSSLCWHWGFLDMVALQASFPDVVFFIKTVDNLPVCPLL